MKTRLFLPLLCLFLFATCTKDIKDERDGFVGRYDYTYTLNGSDVWGSYSDSGTGTVYVTKGPPNEMIFKEGDFIYRGFMYENGNFVVPKDIIDLDGDAYELTGEGQFIGDLLSITLKVEATGFHDVYISQINGKKQ